MFKWNKIRTKNDIRDAINIGNLEIIKYLVSKGAQIDIYDINNAISLNNSEIIKYLFLYLC